ncbi:G-type lectin S-receptor-like serine/threonine-protein kinase [Senna tora]|uniref:G-type lectin S-receptor-like serine/threonine-protein kinase n=1 Tax=Senna tora TaxID=362788 RepID=A0A834WL35_9FABA|nr:G-type lectin S-receptor-like serine/threonine-protein kinase [Senna tora]
MCGEIRLVIARCRWCGHRKNHRAFLLVDYSHQLHSDFFVVEETFSATLPDSLISDQCPGNVSQCHSRFGCTDSSQISLGSRLVAGKGEVWASQNGTFAFGFTPSETDGRLFALAIWFAELPGDRTLVWSPNRYYSFRALFY